MPTVVLAGKHPWLNKLLRCRTCQQTIRIVNGDPIPKPNYFREDTVGTRRLLPYQNGWLFPCKMCDDLEAIQDDLDGVG
jgi:hypothetical protein